MKIGVIGGSGLYDWGDASLSIQSHEIETPYGRPSDTIQSFESGQHEFFFVPRHGKGHNLLPSEINYRANLFALKSLNVQTVLAFGAVGSLREDIHPGDFFLPSQFVDLTKGQRDNSFFGEGIVGHAPMADPTCETTRQFLTAQIEQLDVAVSSGGSYVCIEGPAFSSRAESDIYRSWRASVVGMTAMPEAKLAREIGVCYQPITMITDYDCWKPREELNVEDIMAVLRANVDRANQLIKRLAKVDFPACRHGCAELMKKSVVTSKEIWPEGSHAAMRVILGDT